MYRASSRKIIMIPVINSINIYEGTLLRIFDDHRGGEKDVGG